MLNLHSGEVATECTISMYIRQKKGEKKSFFYDETSRRRNQFKGVVSGGQLHTSPVFLHRVCNWYSNLLGHELKFHSSRQCCVSGCCSSVRGKGWLTAAGSECALMKCSPIAGLIWLFFPEGHAHGWESWSSLPLNSAVWGMPGFCALALVWAHRVHVCCRCCLTPGIVRKGWMGPSCLNSSLLCLVNPLGKQNSCISSLHCSFFIFSCLGCNQFSPK